MRVYKDPRGVILPSDNEIRELAQRKKIKHINLNFFKDVLSALEGGKKKGISMIERELEIERLRNNFSSSYVRRELKKAINRMSAIEKIIEFLNPYKNKFKNSVELVFYLIELLNRAKINQDEISPEDAEILFEIETETEELDKNESKLLFHKNEKVDKMKVIANSRKREILKISRKLNQLSDFSRSIKSEPKPDPEGDEIRYRQMRKVSELLNIPIAKRMIDKKISSTYYTKKVALMEYDVKERVKHTDKKQIIYILLDGSGSMDEYDKITTAIAVVFNRLQAVMKGDAEVWISPFESYLYEETVKAYDEKTAKHAWDWIWKNHYSGGGTDIAEAVKEAVRRIEKAQKENEKLTKPDIIVITDDDSSSSQIDETKLKELEVRLHGIVVGGESNPDLKKCIETNGIYLEF